ncbi:MAG: hypothetical protein FWC83_00135 [Alphaproteobacteria bacterium]|nr:hypothetical protein [Alphaproteobacteria bacterium]
MKQFLAVVFVGLMLAGCGQIYDRTPVGIGWGNDELNLSPCACLRVFMG